MHLFFPLKRHRHLYPDHLSSQYELTIPVHGQKVLVNLGTNISEGSLQSNRKKDLSFFKSVATVVGSNSPKIVETLYYQFLDRNGRDQYVPYKTRYRASEQISKSYLSPTALTYYYQYAGHVYSHPGDVFLTNMSLSYLNIGEDIQDMANSVSSQYAQNTPVDQWLVPETHLPEQVESTLLQIGKIFDMSTPAMRRIDTALSLVHTPLPARNPIMTKFSKIGALSGRHILDDIQRPYFDTTIPDPIIPRSGSNIYRSPTDTQLLVHYLIDSVPPDFEVGYMCELGKEPVRGQVVYVYDRYAPFMGESDYDRVENLFLIDNVANCAARWFHIYSATDPDKARVGRDGRYSFYIRRSYCEEACVDFLLPDGTAIVSIYLDLALLSMMSVGLAAEYDLC